METKERKNAVWSKVGDLATVSMPDGEEWTFDFSKLSNEACAFYGKKQILSDRVASLPPEEKLQGMKDFYREAVESGLELTETGKVQIIGKTRSNASVKTGELKQVKNLASLLMKKLAGEALTEEEELWIMEMTEKFK